MIAGGKSKYVCLLSMIKHASPDLYSAICDLCLDGMFRSQRFKTTFLMPNKALSQKIKALVDSDKDLEAIAAIRTLMLKNHLNLSDFKKGAKIATSIYEPHILSSPEEVGKALAKSSNMLITTKTGAPVNLVYEYTLDSIPKVEAGSASESARGGAYLVGGSPSNMTNPNAEAIKRITLELITPNNANSTIENFNKAVCGALAILKKNSPDRFDRAKYYLAENPILSWFFLTMPTRHDALVTSKDLEHFAWKSVIPSDIVKRANSSNNYTPSAELLKTIRDHRSRLINNGSDKASLIPNMHVVYEELMPKLLQMHAIDHFLHENKNVKKLMDGLRFQYEQSVHSWSDVQTAISALGAVNWSNPSESYVIFNQGLYESLKSAEVFQSGPVTFVKTIYFVYIPLSEAHKSALGGNMRGGAVLQANPASINSVLFYGGSAMEKVDQYNSVKLESIVRVLTDEQRETLKALL